jgi:hypothetical protein
MDLTDVLDDAHQPMAQEVTLASEVDALSPERDQELSSLTPVKEEPDADPHPLRCRVCGYTVSAGEGARSNLLRHMRTHTGERAHSCDFCASAFTTLQNLRRHIVAKHPGSPVPPSRAASRAPSRAATPVAMGGPPGVFPSSSAAVTLVDGSESDGAEMGSPVPTVAAVVVRASAGSDRPQPSEAATRQPLALPTRHPCDACNKSFAYSTSLQYHRRQAHPELAAPPRSGAARSIEVECPHCFTLLSSKAKLNRHLQKHCIVRHEAPERRRNRGTNELAHFQDPSASSAAASPTTCQAQVVDGPSDALARRVRCQHDGCFASFATRRALRIHAASAHPAHAPGPTVEGEQLNTEHT